MFRYCMDVLRLSEDATYNRIGAARAARRHPAILELLASGALTLSTARLLTRRLTDENSAELLAAASGKTKEQVEEILASRFPMPDVSPTVRKLPEPNFAAAVVAPAGSAPMDRTGAAALVAPEAPPPPPSRSVVRPIAPERYEIRFTAGAETRELLRVSQDLLGDAVSPKDLDEVFRRSLRLLVEDLARRKFAATESPRESQGQADGSRHIPAGVKRIVWIRDGGRCAFIAASGRRCEARRNLEFHHVDPYAAGGQPTAGNIQLRCRAHNRHEAAIFYGPMREHVPTTRAGTSRIGEVRPLAAHPGG
jgi:hypothetical protein